MVILLDILKVLVDLGVFLVGPVVQPEFQKGVIHPLRRMRIHLSHVFQKCFQLPRVVGKYWDKFLWVGLEPKKSFFLM